MRRLFASLMTVIMLVMCIQPCFATGDESDFKAVPTVTMDSSDLSIWARKNGDPDYVKDSLDLGTISATTRVDYKINLDMKKIRTLVDTAEQRSDAEKVRNGKIDMTLAVTLTYPEAAIISEENLKNTGVSNTYNGIFVETKREININDNPRTVKSTFALNKTDLTLQNFIDNYDNFLKDISFKLENGIAYSTNGEHKTAVKVEGNVTLTFTDGHVEKVDINTAPAVEHTVSVAVENKCRFVVVDAVAPTCTVDGSGVGVMCTHHKDDPYHKNEDGADIYADGVMEPAKPAGIDDPLKAKGHIFSVVAAIAPTCTVDGVKAHKLCRNCKGTYATDATEYSENIISVVDPKKEHRKDNDEDAIEDIPAKAETCFTDGHTAGKQCSLCKVIISGMEKIPAAHTKDLENEYTASKAATCIEDGCTEGAKCKICNAVLSVSKIVPALGHKYGEWVTNAQDETMTRTCTVKDCPDPTQTVSTHKHSAVREVRVEPTCTKAGSITKLCNEDCGYVISVTELPKLKHSNLPKTPAIAATCITEGNIEYYSCVDCGLNYRTADGTGLLDSVIIPRDKNNHEDLTNIAEIVTDETCLKPGLKIVAECESCGYVKSEIIPQYVHKASDEDAGVHTLERIEKAVGCETDGIIAHLHCPTTGKDFSLLNNANGVLDDWTGKDFVIPAKGHNWEKDGDEIRCSVCGANKAVTNPCADNAHQYHRATITEATCYVNGTAKDICLLCGHSNSVTLQAGHSYGTWIPEVSSSCTIKGTLGHYHCLKCNGYFDANKNSISEINLDLALHKMVDGRCINNCGYKVVEINNAKKVEKAENINNAHIKDDDESIAQYEEDFRKAVNDIGVTLNYIFEDRYEVSDKIDEAIQEVVKNKNLDEIDSVGKIPFEVTVEKVIEYKDKDGAAKKDITEIKETTDFIEMTIDISSLKDMIKFVVHRLHNGVVEYIEEVENKYGEKILGIIKDGEGKPSKLKFKARRFSEYAVVGYSEDIGTLNPPVEDDSPSNVGGGGSSIVTVRFHANGGTVVESVKVKRGEKITAPTTTRDGYKFAGWYTDSSLTKEFDFSTPIKSSLNLYAKWVEDGTITTDSVCGKFTDINIAEWYHEGIHYAIENGMMNGTGAITFEPETTVSRAMLVTVLWRAENKPAATSESAFVDLKNGEYYVDAVKWANENGVVTGTTETTFAPDSAITREQFAAIMFRYAKLKGFDVSVGENTNILSYTDFNQISEYAIPAMQYAVGSGLLKGKTASTLNPIDNATRAEMATILYRFFNANK